MHVEAKVSRLGGRRLGVRSGVAFASRLPSTWSVRIRRLRTADSHQARAPRRRSTGHYQAPDDDGCRSTPRRRHVAAIMFAVCQCGTGLRLH